MVEHALRRGELDNFTFFALDLDDDPLSRVKVYVSHDAAEAEDAVRAAALVPGTDPMLIREFLAVLGGGKGPFEGRPLVSSYSFVEGMGGTPGNYSIYLPIRSYVPDDEVAWRACTPFSRSTTSTRQNWTKRWQRFRIGHCARVSD